MIRVERAITTKEGFTFTVDSEGNIIKKTATKVFNSQKFISFAFKFLNRPEPFSNLRSAYSLGYVTGRYLEAFKIDLEFEVCNCCGNLISDGYPADTEFNKNQFKKQKR